MPVQTLYRQKLESMNYMTAAVVLVCLYLPLRSSLRKPRKAVQEQR